MKAIAIVELPDDAFEWGGKWMIDDKGAIRYNWMHYKDIDAYGIELRPLPKKAEMTDDWRVSDLIETESGRMARCYFKGYNACLKEITGETDHE